MNFEKIVRLFKRESRSIRLRRTLQGVSAERQELLLKLANKKRNRKRDLRSIWITLNDEHTLEF